MARTKKQEYEDADSEFNKDLELLAADEDDALDDGDAMSDAEMAEILGDGQLDDDDEEEDEDPLAGLEELDMDEDDDEEDLYGNGRESRDRGDRIL